MTERYGRSGCAQRSFQLLVVLAHAGALGMTELAQALGLDRTSLTRNLKPAERKGWVRVEQGEDRRRRTIAITPAGDRRATAGPPGLAEGAGERRAETQRLRAGARNADPSNSERHRRSKQ